MKLKGKIKCLLMMFIMTIILSLGSSVFASNFTIHYDGTKVEPYEWDSNFFCIHKGRALWAKGFNGMDLFSRELSYKPAETIQAEQSIAFGLFTARESGNWNCPSIQQVIWASGQFSGLPGYVQTLADYDGRTTSPTSGDPIEARSNQFAQFYYKILKGQRKLNFSTETDKSKVLVDYDNQTMTVGPYKIDVESDDKDAKTILYNELAGINAKNYPNTPEFANYEIKGIKGKNIHFVDKNGKTLAFPNWGKEFYIRFTPNDGVTTINPKIIINYVSKVDATVKVYRGERESFKGSVEGLWVKDDQFDAKDYIGQGYLGQFVVNAKNINVTKYTQDSYQIVGSHQETDDNGDTITVDDYDWVTYVTGFEYTAEISDPEKVQEVIEILGFGINIEGNLDYDKYECTTKKLTDTVAIDLGVKDVSIQLGGQVWVDLPGVKLGNFTGVRSEEDSPFAGMQVQLFDEDGNLVATTSTDNDGKYHFNKLFALKKYYVEFMYNGQIYQNTYYKNDLSGGYSNAMEKNREEFNNKFGTIDSTTQNYKVGNEWHRAYALLSKLAKEDGEYIENGKDENGNIKALTYQDAWNKFLEFSISTKSYEKAYDELANWLGSRGVGQGDINGVITFIKDSMITATTLVDDPLTEGNGLVKYPVYNQFVTEDINNPPDEVETITLDKVYYYLYTKKSDQSRYVDYGINLRTPEELYLQKDVYKATVIVNGKKHDYMYSKKNLNDDGSWSVELRASDALYNGRYSYAREIRKSEYLYDGSDAGTTDAKNLQVFVTYRIAVKNRSQLLYSTVNEIVDYYDADQYTFDGTLNENGTYTPKSYNNYDENGNITGTYINSYLGSDAKGTKQGDITVSNETSFADREKSKTLTNGNYNYSSLYITGIKSPSGSDRLAPGEIAYAYVTFKANTDPATGKVKLDQDLNTGEVTIGKRNIAEINGYSTYYSENYAVPGYLNEDNSTVDKSVANKTAGIVDTLSNAGSLEETDLTDDGDLRTSTTSEVENRLEMDTDKAPNLKLIIDQNDDDIRRMSGYVFEDERTVTNDKAVVGDGKHQEEETKVNGVTTELVELVQNVDENGIFLGSYSEEKVWGTNIYALGESGLEMVDEDFTRYFSGQGKSKVIIKGPGILDVVEDDLGENNGEYSFKSVPAGDFFIRFTYGDDKQTILTNSDNVVNDLLGEKGLNAKSYNGQDYKSTTYQTEIDQNSSYNGINGFTNYETQNYVDAKNKSAMYYYDIGKSEAVKDVSDAKDVYSYRESVNDWSSGANDKTLLNNRAEILTSFESLGTYKYETDEEQKQAQETKIKTLMDNTKMVAQTGVIDTEIEYNRTETDGQGDENNIAYKIEDIDLGLQERPEAQLKLNKEITNFKITLGKNVLFDTTQSVTNLFFAKHDGHKANFEGFRLKGYELGKNSKELPELIQAYMDEELISGAKMQADYELAVENVGEVDYLDKQFYYTGKTAHPDDSDYVSKTNAKSVIDYVSNLLKYEPNYQSVDSNWEVVNANDIIKSTTSNDNKELIIDESKIDEDLVNRQYFDKLSTYNILISTDKLSGDLLPSIFKKDNSSKSTTLILSTLLSNNEEENFVYNNLAEITSVSNTQGRRMIYSVVGNQEMADQSLGSDASSDTYTSLDLVTPSEMDADSAQKIVILPPQGENRNFVPMIITGLLVAFIFGIGIVLIKKKV